jgi:lipopolysaccharide export system protein LptA
LKIITILFLSLLTLYAEKIVVTADKFEAYENRSISILQGHVHIQKGKDSIRAQKLIIDFGPDNKPIRYTLSGNVQFDISTKRQHLVGTAQKIVYDPIKKRYIATGNVHMEEKNEGRLLEGSQIVIDRISGKSTIRGKKNRPVKFIFTVEE